MKASDDAGPVNDEHTDLKAADHERFFEVIESTPCRFDIVPHLEVSP